MDMFVLLLHLYGCEVALSFHRAIFEYHIIHLEKTWFEARQYCRQHYTDLAMFRDMDDIHSFKRPSSFTELVWIGLFDDPASWKQVMNDDSNSWRWSVTGTTSPGGYQNWMSGEPEYYKARQYCGLIKDGLWRDGDCVNSFPFVCFTGSAEGPKQYTYISTPMSWEEARSHCRQHYTDLAMIEDESENTAVLMPDTWAWTGLYRRPWRWSDGSDSQFTNWRSDQPNNLGQSQHCVYEDNHHLWIDKACSEERKFVCQREVNQTRQVMISLPVFIQSLKLETSVPRLNTALKNNNHLFTVKLQSDVDLSDPAHSTQLTEKLVAMLQDKGLTDLNVKWKAPPQRINEYRKSLDFECEK